MAKIIAAQVCGNCAHAIPASGLTGMAGYPRIDHTKVDDSRFCRRFPRSNNSQATVVDAHEPKCGEFALCADPHISAED